MIDHRCPEPDSDFFGRNCQGPYTIIGGKAVPRCGPCLERQALGLDPVEKDDDEEYARKVKPKRRKPF